MDNQTHDFLVLLNDLARSLRTEADRRARLHGMTRAQWIILKHLEQTPGLSQRELAEILEVEPITVGRLVDRLESRALVERKPDPDDRRVWRLHLRPAGLPLLETLNIQRDSILETVSHGVDPAALIQVCDVLNQMKTNMTATRRPISAAPTAAPRTADEKESA